MQHRNGLPLICLFKDHEMESDALGTLKVEMCLCLLTAFEQ